MDSGIPQMTPIGGSAANLSNDVNSLAPLASTWSGAAVGVPVAQNITGYNISSNQGVVGKFTSFLGGLASETGHIAGGAASWLLTQGKDMLLSPYHVVQGIGNSIYDNTAVNAQLNGINTQTSQISAQLQTLHDQFKSGTINSTQYSQGLKALTSASTIIDQQTQSINNQLSLDKAATVKAFVDLTSAVVTVMTVGTDALAGASLKLADQAGTSAPALAKAATWLGSEAAKPMLEPLSNLISKMSVDSNLFNGLNTFTSGALQKATAETIASASSTMTSAQLARATATNIALKYPMIFQYYSSSANQMYQELDQAKYGTAIRQLAFNAMLLSSGGIIGQAIKFGGTAVKSITAHTFGQTSFWDTLSTLVDKGQTDGFSKVISNIANNPALLKDLGYEGANARDLLLKDLSSVEAMNVKAMNGDVVAAANRVGTGMQSGYSIDLKQMTHEEVLTNQINYIQAMREYNVAAQKLGLGDVIAVRFDIRERSAIADAVSAGNTVQEQLKNFEAWKVQNPNSAASFNENLSRQVEGIIHKGGDVNGAIKKITGAKMMEGMPQDVIDRNVKRGYVPAQINKLEAPYVEGTGKVVTKYTENGADFFTKAVQPLPVLGSIGKLMTGMGLSPYASSERTYQIFNDNIALNLEGTNAARILKERNATQSVESKVGSEVKVGGVDTNSAEYKQLLKDGYTPEWISKNVPADTLPQISGSTSSVAKVINANKSTSDIMIKQLSNYAKGLKIPIGDLRLLTNWQIQKALKVGYGDAAEVMQAINKAHIQVPAAVKGLGAFITDATMLSGSGVVARRYLKLQGAGRFTFNPFYKLMRLIPKTEILAEASGGGWVRAMFLGRWQQVSETRQFLRANKFFSETGTLTGEATDTIGMVDRNLSKKILPAQEESLSALVDSMGQKMGMSGADYATKFPQETAHIIQSIAEYDKTGNFLNSPLAKTLNIAFFPFRFDAKVAGFMAKALARQEPMVQVAIVNGLMQSNTWMKSPEGMAWYSQNADAIKLFTYITPLATLNEVFQSLLPGHDHSLGNFGELGGLPFGWIPLITDQTGLTHFAQATVDAKTGDTMPHYVGATEKGNAAIAIQDLINMLFSYPGATAGLPSKSSITRQAALGLVQGNKKTDLKLVTPQISTEAQAYQKQVQQQNGTSPVPQMTPMSQPATLQYQVPTQQTPTSTPRPPKQASGKLKKSQIRPTLPSNMQGF